MNEKPVIDCFGLLKKGFVRNFNVGRLAITESTIIWKALVPLPLRILPYMTPKALEIPLDSIRQVTLHRQLWRTWLRLETNSGSYIIRPGRGIFLRDNPETTRACLEAIEKRLHEANA
jgi:hypothetical protein